MIFGGGSPDGSPSEDLSGVEFVNGTRPGNPELMELAKQQVGNVGGYPYWSWYGFNSRVEWCACFVSWCYNQAGKSEPRFAGCEWQGVPWFQSRGQWGARGYENIAPGDAIFFDWDLDAITWACAWQGRKPRLIPVQGNSGDACKIKRNHLPQLSMYQRLRADELVTQPQKERRIYFMANNKIDRINKEIAKTREKITEYQNKLKGLEAQKTEAENLEIVQLVRAMRMTPQELNAMLKGDTIPGMSAAPASDEAADYEEQEDNADEE